jgi:hypothetical protein
MSPLDLPDGRPPLAREFSEAQLMHRIVTNCIAAQGGALGVSFIPERTREGSDAKVEAHWMVGAEYGREAPDSPMAGAAIYGTGLTLRAALEQAGDDARLWRSDAKVAAEVEKESHKQEAN